MAAGHVVPRGSYGGNFQQGFMGSPLGAGGGIRPAGGGPSGGMPNRLGGGGGYSQGGDIGRPDPSQMGGGDTAYTPGFGGGPGQTGETGPVMGPYDGGGQAVDTRMGGQGPQFGYGQPPGDLQPGTQVYQGRSSNARDIMLAFGGGTPPSGRWGSPGFQGPGPGGFSPYQRRDGSMMRLPTRRR